MKKPKNVEMTSAKVEDIIKKNSNTSSWIPNDDLEDKQVPVSLRMSKSLKDTLERKAASNKKKREHPYSLTDFIIKAVSEYVEKNEDYFKSE